MDPKVKVAVIFGGQSSEHEVSRVSASSVIRNLNEHKYDIIKIGISKTGIWNIFNGPVERIEDGTWEKELKGEGLSQIEEVNRQVDVYFPVMHGLYGEDGCVQGLFELLNKPYVGPGILGSALGMDKAYAKKIFDFEGLPQVRYSVLILNKVRDKMQDTIKQIEEEFGYPCFVKPSNAGSSVGISKAHNRKEFVEAINLAGQHDRKIVVEEFVCAREIECAVLGNENPIASVLGEVIPSREFYDYDSKYNDNTSEIIIPAQIEQQISDKIREYAIKAFKALDCFGMSRVDFFLRKDTGEIYLNEINTIPGFTSISMYPKLMEASGIMYSDLLDRLIGFAFERYNKQKF